MWAALGVNGEQPGTHWWWATGKGETSFFPLSDDNRKKNVCRDSRRPQKKQSFEVVSVEGTSLFSVLSFIPFMGSSSLCMKPGASGVLVEPGRTCQLGGIERRADSATIWNPRQCGSLPSWCPGSFFSSWPLGLPTLGNRGFALLPVRSKSNSLLSGDRQVAALPVPDALPATAHCKSGLCSSPGWGGRREGLLSSLPSFPRDKSTLDSSCIFSSGHNTEGSRG